MNLDIISQIQENIKGDIDSYLTKFQKLRDKLLDDYTSVRDDMIDYVDKFSSIYYDGPTDVERSDEDQYQVLLAFAQWLYSEQTSSRYYDISTSHGAYAIRAGKPSGAGFYTITVGPDPVLTHQRTLLYQVWENETKYICFSKYYDTVNCYDMSNVLNPTSIEELISSVPSSLAAELQMAQIADAVQLSWQSSRSEQSGYNYDQSSSDTNALSLAVQNQRSAFLENLKTRFSSIDGFNDLKDYIYEAVPYGLPAIWNTIANYVKSCQDEATEQSSSHIELNSTQIELNNFGTGMVLAALGELVTSIGTVLISITKIGAAITLAAGLVLQLIDKVSKIADKNFRSTKFTVDSNGEYAFSFVLDQLRDYSCPALYDYIVGLDAKIVSFHDTETPVVYYVYIHDINSYGVTGKFVTIEAHLSALYDISSLFTVENTGHIIGATSGGTNYYQMMVVPNLNNALWNDFLHQDLFPSSPKIYPMVWTNYLGLYYRYSSLQPTYMVENNMLTHGGDSGLFVRYVGDKNITTNVLPTTKQFMDASMAGISIDAITQYSILNSEELEAVLETRLLSGMWLLSWYFLRPLLSGVATGLLTNKGEYSNTRWIGWANTNGFINALDPQWYQPTDFSGGLQDLFCWVNALPALYFDHYPVGEAATLFIWWIKEYLHTTPYLHSKSFDSLIGLVASQFDALKMWNRRVLFDPTSSDDRTEACYGWVRFGLTDLNFYWSSGQSQSSIRKITNEWDGTDAISMVRMGSSGWYGPLQRVFADRLTVLFADRGRGNYHYTYRGQTDCFAFSLPTLTFTGYLAGLIVDGILALAVVGLAVGAVAVGIKAKKAIARKSTDVTAAWYKYQDTVSKNQPKEIQNAAWNNYTRLRFKYNILALLTGSDRLTLTANSITNDSLSVFSAVRKAAQTTDNSLGDSNDSSSMSSDSSAQAKLRYLSGQVSALDDSVSLLASNISSIIDLIKGSN